LRPLEHTTGRQSVIPGRLVFAEEMPTPVQLPRNASVDVTRGLVMVLMALDHSREFLFRANLDPLELTQPSPVLFFTRWITHFSAPAFFFLAGTGAALSLGRGKSRGGLARFLVTRGLGLILLELTVVKFAWTFFATGNSTSQLLVLWALGCSMLVLAVFVYLPPMAAALAGIMLIAGHNLLDAVPAATFDGLAGLWNLLHVRGGMVGSLFGQELWTGYPLLPWPGVMLLGWAYGAAAAAPGWLAEPQRKRRTLALGITLMLLFLLVRGWNGYGDPMPWTPQATPLLTLLSFLNTTKYPPSLAFLLMTLGPLLLALALWDRPLGWLSRWLRVYGRAPLFFYLVHLPLLHLAGALLYAARFGTAEMWRPPWLRSNPGLGQPLWAVYAVWLAVTVLLFPLCRWWAELKQRRDGWLSYL
jgi:uncharacterized membrane protein